MGAYLSKGGKSFICLSSTVTGKDGTMKSRIVPTLTNGSICTDPRSCVHYIVTEYGMVNLKGLSTWERAEALISIAHPDFREQLIADAEKMGIWRRVLFYSSNVQRKFSSFRRLPTVVPSGRRNMVMEWGCPWSETRSA